MRPSVRPGTDGRTETDGRTDANNTQNLRYFLILKSSNGY